MNAPAVCSLFISMGSERRRVKRGKKIARKTVSKFVPAAAPTPTVFPIAGIGASAGGLEALGQLFGQLAPHTGIAFVVVQHLDPTHDSLYVEILARETRLPVEEIKSGVRVKPDHIYVIPSNRNLEIHRGVLNLLPRSESRGAQVSIDSFLQSLARDQGKRAIGIILSGTASDGSQGLEAIKAAGGIAIAQDPASAKFDGMPRSAIASGVVDMVLTPQQIAKELFRLARHPLLAHPSGKPGSPLPKVVAADGDGLEKILSLLRTQVHVDFTHYKHTTLRRRIARRMVLHKSETLDDYAKYCQSNPQEVRNLFADVLINVTGFFRDPDVFVTLKKRILPKMLKTRRPGPPIRIWVVGCATGEEVYSVAMSLLEILGDTVPQEGIQIFGTDISEPAIQKARTGVYPDSIRKDVSQERLDRFFVKTESGFKINKTIRDLCLFSRHDITADPPFPKLDLVCCRNLLIYFDVDLQKRVLPLLHYALNPGGFLWLGRSETVGRHAGLFRVVDKTGKFYLRSSSSPTPRIQFRLNTTITEKLDPTITKPLRNGTASSNIQSEMEQSLLSHFAPPAVVINDDMEITLSKGNTAPYLQLPTGQASFNIFKMARAEFVTDLRMAIQAARKRHARVEREGISYREGEQQRRLNITVSPLGEGKASESHFLILFQSVPDLTTQISKRARSSRVGKGSKRSRKSSESASALKDQKIKDLESRLTEAAVYQQSLIEDHEATQEEITSASEELQSTNEELQSTNEELETAKEELQATNEELTTTNDELQTRNSELNTANANLARETTQVQLFEAVTVAANESATLTAALQIFLDRVCVHAGWQIGHAFRASGNGDYISAGVWHIENPERFSSLKAASEQLTLASGESLLSRAVSTRKPVVISDLARETRLGGAIQAKAAGLKSAFAFPVLLGQSVDTVLEFFSTQAIQPDDRFLEVMTHMTPQLARVIERMKSVDLAQQELKRLVEARTSELQSSLREKEAMLKEIHHRVKNNLQVISSLLKLQADYLPDAHTRELFLESQNRIRSMALVHEKLYGSSDLSRINFSDYIESLAQLLFRSSSIDGAKIHLTCGRQPVLLNIQTAVPCGLIVSELLSNCLKHAFPNGRTGEISASIEESDRDEITVRIADNGIGLPKDFDYEKSQSLGLQLVRTLVKQIEGQLHVTRAPGTAVTITFRDSMGAVGV